MVSPDENNEKIEDKGSSDPDREDPSALQQVKGLREGMASKFEAATLNDAVRLKQEVRSYKKTHALSPIPKIARNTVAVPLTEHMWRNISSWLAEHSSIGTRDMFIDEKYFANEEIDIESINMFKSRSGTADYLQDQINSGAIRNQGQLQERVTNFLIDTLEFAAQQWFMKQQEAVKKYLNTTEEYDVNQAFKKAQEHFHQADLHRYIVDHAQFFDGKQTPSHQSNAPHKLVQSRIRIVGGLKTGVDMTLKVFSQLDGPSTSGIGYLSNLGKNVHLDAFSVLRNRPVETHGNDRIRMRESEEETLDAVTSSIERRPDKGAFVDNAGEAWITGCPAFFAEGIDPKKNVMQELYEWTGQYCQDIGYWELLKQLEN